MLKDVRRACKINDTVFLEIVAGLRSGKFKTERDISRFILKRFKDFGAGYSYPSIVANNNSDIHPIPGKKKLERGFLVMDFGARVNNSCSDMTRTVFIGKANAKEKKLYDLILRCQKACIKKVKAGVNGKDLDLFARKFLGKYDKNFIHTLGHGIGYRVHQKPKINCRVDDYFKTGDIIAIEPGIYLEKERIGIRIEDTILVKQKGYEVLTHCPKRLIEIKYKK